MSDFGDDDVEDFFDEGVADWLYVEDTWDEAVRCRLIIACELNYWPTYLYSLSTI